MKIAGRGVAICLCIAVIYILMRPYLFVRMERETRMNSLKEEPTYKGKPLHEWAVETQDESITGGPSPEAITAANAIQAIGPDAIPWLIKWIQPPIISSEVSGGAVESIKILGPRAKTAIPELVRLLNQKSATMDDSSTWHCAAEALSYLGPESIPYMLTAATNLAGEHDQWELVQDFGNLETNGVTAIPALIGWTHDTNEWVRAGAVEALGRIGMEPDTVIPVLRTMLKDPDPMVRRDVASALGEFGNAAKGAIPALIKALDDPSTDAQTGAIEALGEMGERRDVILPLLAKKLYYSPDGTVRRVAGFALGDLGGEQAFDVLIKATDDPDGFVREAVFNSLTKIDTDRLAKSGKKFY